MASSLGAGKMITNGLVLHLDAANVKSYPGSGTTWTDLISNESTCSFINGPTVTASFGGGNKIRLDATNDYMEIGNRETLNPTQYITCASWFLYTTYSAYWAPVIFKKTTGNSYYEQYALSIDNDGFLYMKIGNGASSNIAVASSISYKNQLIYGVGIIDTPNRAFRVYADGTCVGSSSHAFATMATSSVNLRIGGANVSNFQGWFGGDIYTAEVYNRVLTDEEILQNYNAVAEKYGKNVVVTDLDALAFVNKAMLTSETQKKAINDLVVDLKSNNLWSKMKAIYPFVGGTAASHKWNLKDPRDLDAAFRLQFNGGWTHSSNGADPNGTTAYADTFLTPSSTLLQNSTHISFYSRENSTGTEVEMGVSNSTTQANRLFIEINTSGTTYISVNDTFSTTYVSFADTDARGYYIGTRTSSNSKTAFRNNIVKGTSNAVSDGLANWSIYIGAYHSYTGAPIQYYSTKQCAFATIGDGLTDADATNLYTIVQKYQTTLGRQV